jgi:DNA-binding NarL/FixJ family response regulator
VASVGCITDITHFKTDNSSVSTVETFNGRSSNKLLFKKVYFSLEEDAVLSKSELAVLPLIAEGYSSKQIAGKLHLSIHTIHNHRKSMLRKMNVRSSAELINAAIIKHYL